MITHQTETFLNANLLLFVSSHVFAFLSSSSSSALSLLSFSVFMASSNNNIQAISRSRKHQNSAVTIALGRRRGTHKKHSGGGDGNCSSPVVNSWEGGSKKSEVSARKLAAGLWQMQYIQVSRDHHAAAFGHSSFPSSMSQVCTSSIYHTIFKLLNKISQHRFGSQYIEIISVSLVYHLS